MKVYLKFLEYPLEFIQKVLHNFTITLRLSEVNYSGDISKLNLKSLKFYILPKSKLNADKFDGFNLKKHLIYSKTFEEPLDLLRFSYANINNYTFQIKNMCRNLIIESEIDEKEDIYYIVGWAELEVDVGGNFDVKLIWELKDFCYMYPRTFQTFYSYKDGNINTAFKYPKGSLNFQISKGGDFLGRTFNSDIDSTDWYIGSGYSFIRRMNITSPFDVFYGKTVSNYLRTASSGVSNFKLFDIYDKGKYIWSSGLIPVKAGSILKFKNMVKMRVDDDNLYPISDNTIDDFRIRFIIYGREEFPNTEEFRMLVKELHRREIDLIYENKVLDTFERYLDLGELIYSNVMKSSVYGDDGNWNEKKVPLFVEVNLIANVKNNVACAFSPYVELIDKNKSFLISDIFVDEFLDDENKLKYRGFLLEPLVLDYNFADRVDDEYLNYNNDDNPSMMRLIIDNNSSFYGEDAMGNFIIAYLRKNFIFQGNVRGILIRYKNIEEEEIETIDIRPYGKSGVALSGYKKISGGVPSDGIIILDFLSPSYASEYRMHFNQILELVMKMKIHNYTNARLDIFLMKGI